MRDRDGRSRGKAETVRCSAHRWYICSIRIWFCDLCVIGHGGSTDGWTTAYSRCTWNRAQTCCATWRKWKTWIVNECEEVVRGRHSWRSGEWKRYEGVLLQGRINWRRWTRHRTRLLTRSSTEILWTLSSWRRTKENCVALALWNSMSQYNESALHSIVTSFYFSQLRPRRQDRSWKASCYQRKSS